VSVTARMDGNSAAWRPADNPDHPNPLIGKVVEVEVGTGDFGEYPIVFVLDDKGDEWRVHGFGNVLKKRIATLQPVPGDEIGVKYLGEEPARNYPGKTYRNFKVVVEKGDGNMPETPDWTTMAGSEEDDF